jgi:hypothetical protein
MSKIKIHISKILLDRTGKIPAVVGFDIICNVNNRVKYFEYEFVDEKLVEGFTLQEIINYAWTKIKVDVNTWESNVLKETNLIGYIYVPTVNFNANYTLKVSRFELYPKNDRLVGYVGFNITNNTNNTNNTKILFVDTNVVTKTELDIMDIAWDKLKDKVNKKVIN